MHAHSFCLPSTDAIFVLVNLVALVDQGRHKLFS